MSSAGGRMKVSSCAAVAEVEGYPSSGASRHLLPQGEKGFSDCRGRALLPGAVPHCFREAGEGGDDLEIGLPLERHDEVGEGVQPLPAPGVELGRMGAAAGTGDVNLGLV